MDKRRIYISPRPRLRGSLGREGEQPVAEFAGRFAALDYDIRLGQPADQPRFRKGGRRFTGDRPSGAPCTFNRHLCEGDHIQARALLLK
jgi:hypothetical protein